MTRTFDYPSWVPQYSPSSGHWLPLLAPVSGPKRHGRRAVGPPSATCDRRPVRPKSSGGAGAKSARLMGLAQLPTTWAHKETCFGRPKPLRPVGGCWRMFQETRNLVVLSLNWDLLGKDSFPHAPRIVEDDASWLERLNFIGAFHS